MNIEIKPITYGIYVRKSSEGEDRQVQSLVRQSSELQEIIDREGLIVYPEVFEEKASAFKEGRPVFNRLIEKTKNGEINAWLCWHSNRLSRNPIDGGRIVDLIDKGHLDHIRTVGRTYRDNHNDKLMIAIDFALSKNDSEEKSKIVKSGLRRRIERGYPLGFPLTGFTHTGKGKYSGSAIWIPDEKSLSLVRKVFATFLKGNIALEQ